MKKIVKNQEVLYQEENLKIMFLKNYLGAQKTQL